MVVENGPVIATPTIPGGYGPGLFEQMNASRINLHRGMNYISLLVTNPPIKIHYFSTSWLDLISHIFLCNIGINSHISKSCYQMLCRITRIVSWCTEFSILSTGIAGYVPHGSSGLRSMDVSQFL